MFPQKNAPKLRINQSDFISFFSHGFKVVGDVSTQSDIRVEGIIQGNIKTTKKVFIGITGKVLGDIVADQVVILGEVVGTVKAFNSINIGRKGLLHGMAITNNIEVEFGAEMDASIKKLHEISREIGFKPSSDPDKAQKTVNRASDPIVDGLNSTVATVNL